MIRQANLTVEYKQTKGRSTMIQTFIAKDVVISGSDERVKSNPMMLRRALRSTSIRLKIEDCRIIKIETIRNIGLTNKELTNAIQR